MVVNKDEGTEVLAVRIKKRAKDALRSEATKRGLSLSAATREVFSLGFKHWMKGN